MTLLWWHWLILSLVFALVELGATGGFYMIFFAIGAMLVGVLAAFGAAGPVWMQLLLFSVLSVGSLLLFRTRLLKAVQADPQRPPVDPLVGEVGVVIDELAPGAVGRIELRGTTWSARNAAQAPLARGARCRVVWVDGLTLHVEPEGAHA